MEVIEIHAFKILPSDRRPLNETEKEILAYLLLIGEGNAYKISKEIERRYSGVWKSIKTLIKDELIEEIRTEPSERNPSILTTYYDLSDKGFHLGLLFKLAWDHIDLVAENHQNKLKIFKLWPRFKKDGLKDVIIEEMKFNLGFEAVVHEFKYPSTYSVFHSPDWNEKFDMYIFFTSLNILKIDDRDKDVLKLLEIINSEIIIKDKLIKMMTLEYEETKEKLNNLDYYIKKISN